MSTNAPTPTGVDDPTNLTRPAPRGVDLPRSPHKEWLLVDEHIAAAPTGRTVKAMRADRQLQRGIGYRKLNGYSIRYQLSDIKKWIEAQPFFGGATTTDATPRVKRTAGRPRKGA